MTTKIGLISDVHSRSEPLAQALEIFKREKVSKIICAGDIAGYFDQLLPTIELLQSHQCETVIGNHDQEFLEDNSAKIDSAEYLFLQALPVSLEYEIEGKRVFTVHAHPPDFQHGGIKLLDQNGSLIAQQKTYWADELKTFEYDVLIIGHTHQVFAEHLGGTFVVNPGSSAFNHSCMVLSFPDLQVETFALEDQAIIKSWNFSHLFGPKSAYPPAKNKSRSGR